MIKFAWAIALLLMLAASPAHAVCPAVNVYPFQPGCPLPADELNKALGGSGNIASPADYDPLCNGGNPDHDCAPAINTAAQVTVNGQRVNVRLSAGTYKVLSQLNIGAGQCLYGDGRGSTTISVKDDFDPSATAVILLSGREQLGPCVKELNIDFEQPSDQALRSNFLTLAGGCTSVLGGTGCKYPPAIHLGTSNRARLYNLRISAAWDGIVSGPATSPSLPNNGAMQIDHIESGHLNLGLQLAQAFDIGKVSNYHSWTFGIQAADPLFDVYSDGNNVCAEVGESDGIQFVNFSCFRTKIVLTSDFSWGSFTNLAMDGVNATMEVASTGGSGLQIDNMYVTGVTAGFNTSCHLQFTGAAEKVMITNLSMVINGTGTTGTGICVDATAAKVSIVGGHIQMVATPDSILANVDSGRLSIRDTNITFGAAAWTVPVMVATSATASIIFQNNVITTPTPGDVGFLNFDFDNAINTVSGNYFNGWKVGLLFAGANCFANGSGDCDWSTALNPLGYYDLGEAPFHIVATPTFATPGDLALANVVLTGQWFLRGDFVEFFINTEFDLTHTTAAGNFMLATDMPLPFTDKPRGCSLSRLSKFTITAGEINTLCQAVKVGSITAIELAATRSAAAEVTYGIANLPTGTTSVVLSLAGRYRTR